MALVNGINYLNQGPLFFKQTNQKGHLCPGIRTLRKVFKTRFEKHWFSASRPGKYYLGMGQNKPTRGPQVLVAPFFRATHFGVTPFFTNSHLICKGNWEADVEINDVTS